jgi:hypothetical protein
MLINSGKTGGNRQENGLSGILFNNRETIKR